jgi:hypothetical protein
MACSMSQHLLLQHEMQQPSFVLSQMHWQQLRLKLQISLPSRTQLIEQFRSQIAAHRLCMSAHSSVSSQPQVMRKPPLHFSNENSHATASCRSNFFGAAVVLVLELLGDLIVAVIDIAGLHVIEDFAG